jgi:hypothetical protein
MKEDVRFYIDIKASINNIFSRFESSKRPRFAQTIITSMQPLLKHRVCQDWKENPITLEDQNILEYSSKLLGKADI